MNPTLLRREVMMAGGVELTREAERHAGFATETRMLSLACGKGELECYLAEAHGCAVLGLDEDAWCISKAQEKAAARGLARVRFQVGDIRTLDPEAGAADVVFACGAGLAAFFAARLPAIHRGLGPGGRLVVIDTVWRRQEVPEEVRRLWKRAGNLLFERDHAAWLETAGFRVLFARTYHEPLWWENWFGDMLETSNRGLGAESDRGVWEAVRNQYRATQDYKGLGLFVAERES